MNELPTNWLTGCGPWRQFAACRSADPELFFPVPVPGAGLRQGEEAKAICGGCPVRGQCLAFATVTRQEHGVWGGLTEEERPTPGSGQSPAGASWPRGPAPGGQCKAVPSGLMAASRASPMVDEASTGGVAAYTPGPGERSLVAESTRRHRR